MSFATNFIKKIINFIEIISLIEPWLAETNEKYRNYH